MSGSKRWRNEEKEERERGRKGGRKKARTG